MAYLHPDSSTLNNIETTAAALVRMMNQEIPRFLLEDYFRILDLLFRDANGLPYLFMEYYCHDGNYRTATDTIEYYFHDMNAREMVNIYIQGAIPSDPIDLTESESDDSDNNSLFDYELERAAANDENSRNDNIY
jgi:hypothetical protein